MPSNDGIAANGACWNIDSNSISEMSSCADAISDANNELSFSDQIIMNNLIEDFKGNAAPIEASIPSKIETAERR
jgi:hypothetical protein